MVEFHAPAWAANVRRAARERFKKLDDFLLCQEDNAELKQLLTVECLTYQDIVSFGINPKQSTQKFSNYLSYLPRYIHFLLLFVEKFSNTNVFKDVKHDTANKVLRSDNNKPLK